MSLQKWWDSAKEKSNPEEIIAFLRNNRDKLEESFSKLDGRKRLYSASHSIFAAFDRLAEMADRMSVGVQRLVVEVFGFRGLIARARQWKNHLNFRELVAFGRTKLYSLRHPPHNEKLITVLEEIMDFASRHGLDLNQHIPQARRKLEEKKNQLLQHKFFQEFSKSRLEQLLAVPFSFDRSIFPVLPDSAFWHRVFEFLERKMVVDIILVNRDNRRYSLRHSDSRVIDATDVVKTLRGISKIKRKGHRIFFVGHHEGYLGPYFVRSVVRKLGFDNLTKNCNTIVGPRMFSNLVLRNGAANVGNLFVTVPSQKTTAIKTSGLAEELRKTARRTQNLIKFPDAGLYLVKKLNYTEFKAAMSESEDLERHCGFIEEEQIEGLKAYIQENRMSEAMKNLREEDYLLFKQVMRECFLIFPEGTRSHVDTDGGVRMKYINPRYMEAYMRPGDFILPVNLVGGSDIARGWRLRPAKLGISIGDPIEVTSTMLADYENAGLDVMRKIAALPNIKAVRFMDKREWQRPAA